VAAQVPAKSHHPRLLSPQRDYAGKVPAQVLQKLMRHSNIKVTMTYYANVDDAVEDAVLGKSRVTLRVNPAPQPDEAMTTDDAAADAGQTFD
jgi:hypothetical protein